MHPNSVMLCVGDGEDLIPVQEYAAEIGADSHMLFLGVRRDVPALLTAMDVFLLPSRFEGAPISAVEAQAATVPTIISDRVTDEVVISNNTIQLPITNAVLWAENIIRLSKCNRSGILPEMTNRYSLDQQKQQIIDLLF